MEYRIQIEILGPMGQYQFAIDIYIGINQPCQLNKLRL